MNRNNPINWIKQGGRSLSLVIAGLLLAGCPANPRTSGGDSALAAPGGKKIVIRGSNTVGEELAPQLIAAYRKERPDVTFDMEFKGTAYGIGNLLGGYCDLAAASKLVAKEQEELAQSRGVQFKEYILGSYAVALVINPANPVSNLDSNQVYGLFTGAVPNWKEVGGPDAAVQLYIRDPISGTHLGFKEIAMADHAYAAGARLSTNYQGIIDSVAKDPNGLGYVGVSLANHAGIKTLSINGTAATYANINQQKYPYARTLRFYTDARRESEETARFLSFALSERGQSLLTQLGNAPKP